MQKKDTALSRLVDSLTTGERRYISIKLTNDNSDYKKLFKYVLSQKKYDENQIIKKFEGLYIGNHFSVAKSYLYHSILTYLNLYRSNKKDTNYYISCIETLFEKGLYKDLVRLIKKTYKKTELEFDHTSGLRIIQIIKSLGATRIDDSESLKKILLKEEKLLENLKIHSSYESLSLKTAELVMNLNQENINLIQDLKTNKLLSNKNLIIDLKCKFHYNSIMIGIAIALNDKQLMTKQLKPLDELLEKDSNYPFLKKAEKIKVYQGLTIVASRIKKFDKSIEYCQSLKSALHNSNFLKSYLVDMYTFIYSYQSFALITQRKITEIKLLYDNEINPFIEKSKSMISILFLMELKIYYILVLFEEKSYKRLTYFINTFLNEFKNDYTPHNYSKISLIEIISFIDQKKLDLAETRLKSFDYFLKKEKELKLTYQPITEFCKSIIKGNNIRIALKKCLKDVDTIENQVKNTLNSNFLEWAKSKVLSH